jgi:hypothetical protein
MDYGATERRDGHIGDWHLFNPMDARQARTLYFHYILRE